MDQPPSTPGPVETMTPIAPPLAPQAPGPQVPGKEQPPHAPPPRRRHTWIWVLLLALLGIGGYYYWSKRTAPPPGSPTGKAGGRRGEGGSAAAPVDAAKAIKGNIGVYVTGLGAVTPIYTVTVKTRVDGQLMQVLYKEGDMVHQGDKLAEIDPRPYQAQLTQYEGQLIRDQALLDNARIDQARYETLLKQNAIPEQQLATQVALVKQDEGTVKNDQGLIDSVKVNLIYCNITAPITGRIGLRLVDPGNIVQTSDYHRAAGDHADSADQRDLHHRRGSVAACLQKDECRPEIAGGCVRSRHEEQARDRLAHHHRQPDRSDHGHRKAARDLQQLPQ